MNSSAKCSDNIDIKTDYLQYCSEIYVCQIHMNTHILCTKPWLPIISVIKVKENSFYLVESLDWQNKMTSNYTT